MGWAVIEPGMRDRPVKSKAEIEVDDKGLVLRQYGVSGPENKVQLCRTVEIPLGKDQVDDLIGRLQELRRSL